MPTQLNFDVTINSSLQIGDTLYYTTPAIDGVIGEPLPIGTVTSVLRPQGIIEYEPNTQSQPVATDFVLFSKPIQINESSLKGYYADVTFTNRSTKRAELFAVSSEIALSSK